MHDVYNKFNNSLHDYAKTGEEFTFFKCPSIMQHEVYYSQLHSTPTLRSLQVVLATHYKVLNN